MKHHSESHAIYLKAMRLADEARNLYEAAIRAERTETDLAAVRTASKEVEQAIEAWQPPEDEE